MQNRIHKNVARLVVQSEKLGVLDCFGRRLLGAGDHEFSYRDPRKNAACAIILFCCGVTRASKRSALGFILKGPEEIIAGAAAGFA